MCKICFPFCVSIKMLGTARFLLLILSFLTSIFSYSQKGTFTSSGSLVVPAGVGVIIGGVVPNPLTAKCWGAGGGGGGSNLLTAAGGGGGGGAFKSATVTLVANKDNVTVSYTVGAAGAGGSSSSINGSAGGTTTFPSSVSPVFSYTAVTANGGLGGQGGTSLVAYGAGGSGAAGGDYSGGFGANGSAFIVLNAGGGGGSAGTAANGNSASGTSGGAAKTGGGAGGSGASILGNGSNGNSPGGGGGGGAGLLSPLSATATGGNGGNGQIEVTYTCPTYSVSNVSSTTACAISGTATVTLNSTAAGLPIGTYTITYNRTLPSATALTATMVVETAGTGSFTVTGLTTTGTSTITISNLTSVDCSSIITGKSVDITVRPVFSSGTIANTGETICYNSVPTITIGSTTAASGGDNAITYQWQYSTDNTFTTGVTDVAINSASYTPTQTLTQTTYYRRQAKDGSCNTTYTSATNVWAITVNSLPSTPTVGIVTQPTCALSTGSVALGNLPSGSWTLTQSGTSSASISGSGTTTTISGLAVGTYNFTVFNGSCTSLATANVIFDAIATKTWSGSWSGSAPTIEENVVFAANYNESVVDENVDIQACSCQVNSGVKVTIKSGRYLKLRNELVVDPEGSLTFENNASLVQINDAAVNSGKIIYKRYTKPVKRYDYTYWSSPVTDVNQTLKALSPYTLFDKYYSYNNGWVLHSGGNKVMVPGEGYIIRAPQSFSITNATIDYNPKFEGTPNNGEITKELNGNKVYLLGNPYPSAISADAFLDLNSKLDPDERVLEGTLYFWTHNTAIQLASNITNGTAGSGIYAYTSDDYATYNKTGGVATIATIGGAVQTGGAVLTGEIAAAQGFFAPASATGGTVVFNNSMRLLSNAVMDNSQFFKLTGKTKSTTETEKNRVWLNLSNAQGAFKQTFIGYITGATNEYEGSFDGVSYDGNQFVDFYSINQGSNLSIQGRALPFQKKDSIVLGYKTAVVGDFKISIDHADGALASQNVFLEDRLLQVLHNLKEPYSFATEKGIFNDRFVLRYQDKNDVEEEFDNDEDEVLVEGLLVSVNDKKININSADALIDRIYIYDFSGNKVYADKAINAATTIVSNLLINHQPLIVQVILENGKKAVKKIIY